MRSISLDIVVDFLNRVGVLYTPRANLYLLGGTALCFLGNTRETQDVDYTTDLDIEQQRDLENVIQQIANQVDLDVESVPLAEFIPLPTGAEMRRRFVGRFGNLDVFIFDLYSIALSKIARGFDSDIEDVVFMITNQLIEMDQLEKFFTASLPDISRLDIDRKEYQTYFGELKKRLQIG